MLARAASGGVISIAEASQALGVSRRIAASRLAALTAAGWLTRLRRGYYLVVPLEAASEHATTVEDAWLLAAAMFEPCYVGGWSAAEHWGLTEQLFRSTFVATAANIRARSVTYLGASFKLVRVKAERITKLTPVWRGASRVLVSGRERTLVDAAIDPSWLGGFRHFEDIFTTYTEAGESSELLEELKRSGTGAAAKRIGYLTERLWPDAHELWDAAHAMRSRGVIKLDPAVRRRGSINTRWGLWVNTTLSSKREGGAPGKA
ncbi:MAG: type IV toxin-antitoxin system AbiEi family antitoxin domain-containing protein [Longimicrobiales bacterium]